MADIKGRTIAATYGKLLYTSTDDGLVGNTGSTTSVVTTDDMDGTSTASCLNLGIDRVGIGANDPGTLLEVRGGTGTGSGTAGILTLSTSETTVASGTGDILGKIVFQAPKEGSGTDAILPGAAIWAQATLDFASGANETALIFATAASETASQAGNERMRIDKDGNVGIGTASPAQLLHLKAPTSVDTRLLMEANGANDVFITFLPNSGSGDQFSIGYDDTADCLSITDDAFPSNGDRGIHLKAAGNVGIGTTAPNSKLDVANTSGAQLTLTRMDDSIGSGDEVGSVFFRMVDADGATDSDPCARIACHALQTHDDAHFGAQISFHTSDLTDSTLTQRMTIDEDGRVGIGATNPLYPLHVIGSGGTDDYMAFFDNSAALETSHGIRIAAGDTDHADSVTHYILFEESDGADVGELDSDGGTLALSDASDYRLKENIKPLTGGLEKVNALKPSSYNFKRHPSRVHEGFIAHEVQEAGINYAVKGEKDAMKTKVTPAVEAVDAVLDGDGNIVKEAIEAVVGKTEEVDSIQLITIANLIPQMVLAIQELSAKVTALENA